MILNPLYKHPGASRSLEKKKVERSRLHRVWTHAGILPIRRTNSQRYYRLSMCTRKDSFWARVKLVSIFQL